MTELRFYAAARQEFEDAVRWYATRSTTAAERFESAVTSEIEAICREPQLFPKWDELHRFSLVSGFPYYVAYRSLSNRVEIVAIFHASRDASIWTDR
jgi:toxin ParE1/3/4